MFEFLKLFKRKVKPGCPHRPIPKYDRWENTASGNGFWVSECELCGTEMTHPTGGKWQPIALKDRH